ncbi:phytanoyl-CoA dioxygenase family protein [Pedobacter sp. HDW13]|uniref:phytanoyl-CoA dioxygenase family protein n=1 Tax=unclassified Pedobacter TaxID=2628915 RepID=UPI000F5B5CA7|nr:MULTISPECIES: phytanoyl-CoA dioxygenase family protein [unclassified Pedobacter]QIL42347.1 phytanoyl-CoA dioxygenase family protein [Pedobacter sp. HDW13]RQO78852.1 phytanoyl-CoA dioxygenase [Pedobacter sp. KBW01]
MHDSSSSTIAFLEIYRLHHHPKHPQKQMDESFIQSEQVFLNTFELGIFEIYDFLYSKCLDTDHFKQWIIDLKGADFFNTASQQFFKLQSGNNSQQKADFADILTAEQHAFWNTNGYLKIEQIINGQDCDAVTDLICQTLNIDLTNPQTWYPQHELLQGLMLQKYQDEAIANIRNNIQIKAAFSSLYQHNNILANCEKVSYNPPVNRHFSFKGSPLHWDIDFQKGPRYYIQGLLYLNDVPANRGAFTLIPSFHHQIEEHLSRFDNPEIAITALRNKGLEIPVEGKKGDLIVWLESLPHAASPNHSDLPRFVQYVSFNEIGF